MALEVLHICSDYAKQSIYDQLITHLSTKDVDQKIYVPVRSASELNKYENQQLKNVQYCYSHILTKFDRFHYFGKIKKTSEDLLKHIDIKNAELIHAHFLFSDGGNAYKLHQRYNVPYIVAVRNTDLNIFFKYFIHLRKHALKILCNAKQIIFLSEAYKQQLFKTYIPQEHQEALKNKSMVVPNGVNNYWLENGYERDGSVPEVWQALYVGDFSRNKNIHITTKAIETLRAKNHKIQFTIVGGGGGDDAGVRQLAAQFPDWITLIDRTNDKKVLKDIYRKSHLFVMPSKFETFGLVYIEAMSQGLPVIYSSGQGIDGYFKEGEVGYSVESGNHLALADRIDSVMTRYKEISNNCSKLAGRFSWDLISNTYYQLYKDILVRNNGK